MSVYVLYTLHKVISVTSYLVKGHNEVSVSPLLTTVIQMFCLSSSSFWLWSELSLMIACSHLFCCCECIFIYYKHFSRDTFQNSVASTWLSFTLYYAKHGMLCKLSFMKHYTVSWLICTIGWYDLWQGLSSVFWPSVGVPKESLLLMGITYT